jgi:heme exporter protein A
VYVGHQDGVQGELSLTENLRAQACLEGHVDPTAIAAALERVELTTRVHLPAKVLSQGQHRRLALARLLLMKRPIWILDEPFTALDTKSCRVMTRLLEEQLDRGGLVVLSSHQEFELAGRASRIDLDRVRAAAKTRRARAASPSAAIDHHAT